MDKAKDLINDLEAGIVAMMKACINFQHKLNHDDLRAMFYWGKGDLRAWEMHNIHENIGKIQKGGIGI